MTQPSAASDDVSLAAHVSRLLPLARAQRDGYLNELQTSLADELRALLAFESTALDLSQAAGVSIAQALLHRPQPETLGRWQVIRPLGQGGMGTVYLVSRKELGVTQQAAAKLGIAQGLEEVTLAAIQREADALSRLQHGNIATLLDFGITDTNEPFVISEYIEGEQLLDHIVSHKLDHQAALQLFRHLLSGVTAAHAQLVLHLDIKPSNVLVTGKGTVKLIDFGLAGIMAGSGADRDRGTATGYTDAFASPEQRQGQPVTVRSDIYSLGRLLEEMLGCVACADRPSLLTHEAAAIIRFATQADPLQRYAAVADLSADIDAVLSRRPISPLFDRRGYRWRKFCRRNWLPLSLGVAAVLALSLGLLGVGLQYEETVTERDRALRLLESEKATSDFFSSSIRTASVFGGGDADTTVGEMIEHMVKTLPEAQKMSPRATAWLASDLAAVLTGRGEMDLALEACELAVANAKLSAEIEDDIAHWTQLALTAGQAHQYERALAAAEQARAIAEPIQHWRLPWAYLARMQTLIKMKRWQDVVDLWPEIAAIPTDRASVRGNIDYMRGTARIHLGDFEGARRDLENALTLYSSRYGTRSVPVADTEYRLFQLTTLSGDLDQALAAVADLQSLFADAYGDGHYRHGVLEAEIAMVHFYGGRLDEALDRMEAALLQIQSGNRPMGPTIGYYQTQLARIQLNAGQFNEAAQVMLQATANLADLLPQHADYAGAQLTIGEIALAQKDFKTSASHFAAAGESLSQDSGAKALRYRHLRGLTDLAAAGKDPATCERHRAAMRAISLPLPPPALPWETGPASSCDRVQ